MGIRRGEWNVESYSKVASVKTGRYGARPATIQKDGVSNSEHYLTSRSPSVNVDTIPDGVSEHRKGELIRGTEQRADGQSPAPLLVYSNSYKRSQEIREAYGLNKTAGISISDGSRMGATGGTVRQAPEVYSPLFQIANLQLPRDRITMNAWNRNFYDTHPLVHNCINLHATYPINKINIKCKDRKVEQFFKDMAERMDLVNVLQSVALEFWKMGESVSARSHLTFSDGTSKRITDVKIGDEVLTHLGNKKKVIEKFVKPTAKILESGARIYKIKIHGLDEPLVISSNHPVLSKNRSFYVCSTPSCQAKGMRILPGKTRCSNCGKKGFHNDHSPDFIEAKDLGIKDVVFAPFNTDEINMDGVSNDLCYLIGYWLAEGSYVKYNNGYAGIRFASYDGDYVNDVIDPLLKKCFGHAGKTYIGKKTGFASKCKKYDIQYYSHEKGGYEWAEFFRKHCGEYSKEKKVSEDLMNLPVDLQLDLLAGFVDGDGCIDKQNGHVIISTSSKNLANQFILMLRRAGARASISKARAKCNGKIGADNYRVKVVANEAYELFYDRLKTGKKDLLKKSKWCSPRTAIQENWQVTHITSIEDITDTFDDPVMYDIEVEDDHSYVANGIAVHNCFPYAELDENTGSWKNILIQNPDYIHIKTAVLGGDPVISMRPDAALQRLVHSSNPADIQLRKQIDDEIIYHVKKGNNIPLDNFHISHLAMKSSPYDIHGTSPIVTVYKDLMLYDKLRESKFAQADNLVNPITIVKVGGAAEGEYHPTGDDLEKWRQMFEEAQYDKDFKIISHAGIDVNRVGANGAIIDISGDMTFILDNILYGLMVPKAVVTQEGASFNTATVGLEVLKQRYEAFRNMMAQWLVKKIFAPISEIQEFYEYKDGDKKLIVPEVEWNRMILFDMDNYINVLNTLVQSQTVSKTTLFRSLGLNIEEERRLIKEEMIQQSIAAKEMAILQGMTLGALRSIKADEDIIEPTEAPLPGTPGSQDAGVPGAAAPGGMGAGMGLPPPPGGGGLGGPPMPPLGGPPGGGGLGGPPLGGPPGGGPKPPGGGAGGGGGGAPPPPAWP